MCTPSVCAGIVSSPAEAWLSATAMPALSTDAIPVLPAFESSAG